MAGNCSSVIEYLPFMFRALGLIHRTIKQNTTTTTKPPQEEKPKTHFIDHIQTGKYKTAKRYLHFN